MPRAKRVPDTLKWNLEDIADAAAGARVAYSIIESTIDRRANPDELRALKNLIKNLAEIEMKARDGLDYEYRGNRMLQRGINRAKIQTHPQER